MTIPSNFNATRFSSLAPVAPTERPAAAATAGEATQTRAPAGQPQPVLPSGLIGHHINTSA